jgi:hypothetical protein
MAKKGETNHKDILGKSYGELVVQSRIGTKTYSAGRTSRKCPVFRLLCPRGHFEERSGNSLRHTGDKTQCKVCRRERALFDAYDALDRAAATE